MLHGVQLISKPNISQNGLIYLARLQFEQAGFCVDAKIGIELKLAV